MEEVVVKLNNFEGPFDLLLNLIEKNKMKISDINISQLIDEYLEVLKVSKRENIEIKSDFIIIASELIEIKTLNLLNLDKDKEKETNLRRRLEEHKLFKEVAGIKTLGYIYTSNEANSASALNLVKKGCAEQGLTLVTQAITNSSEVKQAAETLVKRVDGLYLSTDNTVFSALPAVVNVFAKAKKPIFSGDVTGAKNGGIFMASGFNYYKAGRATGEMVVEILRGAKPADMPIRFMTEPSDSDLLIDVDAAAACGIAIPKKYADSANYIYKNGKLTAR